MVKPAGAGDRGAPPRPSRSERRAQKKIEKERRKANRRRWSRSLVAGLVVVALIVAGMLLAAAGGDGDGDAGDDLDEDELTFDGAIELVGLTDSLPFDPEGTSPFTEVNSRAGLAIDRDPETSWRTETYNDPFTSDAGLKSGVGLIVTLEGEQALRGIQVLSASDGWRVEVYVGDDFGPNGRDFDRDAVGEPAAVLEGGERDRARLFGATGPRVLLWVTETGVFDDDERGEVYRFVLREVALI